MAKGPPHVRNLSLGAQAATVDRPPTIPAVYQAARVRIGPPSRQMGATTAPRTAQWSNQAACFALGAV